MSNYIAIPRPQSRPEADRIVGLIYDELAILPDRTAEDQMRKAEVCSELLYVLADQLDAERSRAEQAIGGFLTSVLLPAEAEQ